MTKNNKVVVVTGGNRGIGADITRRFLEGGYQVVNISRQTPGFSHERLINYTADRIQRPRHRAQDRGDGARGNPSESIG